MVRYSKFGQEIEDALKPGYWLLERLMRTLRKKPLIQRYFADSFGATATVRAFVKYKRISHPDALLMGERDQGRGI
jgi:hypothetical protein